MEFFIPKLKQMVTGDANKKSIGMKTLLYNLIFVHADEEEELKPFMKKYPYVLVYCNMGSTHMIVPDKEMEAFIIACKNYNDSLVLLGPSDYSRNLGKRVRIIDGALCGHVGLLVKVKGKRAKQVVIELEDIAAVSVSIKPEEIEFLD
jgi:transcription antitermination factor NusG